MKILHIVANISLRSGVMSFLMSYYRKIDKSKVQFDFLYFEDKNVQTYEEEIKQYGGNIFKITSPKSYFKFRKEIKLLIIQMRNQYDIIHVHDPFLISFFYTLKKNQVGKKIVTHAHSTRFSDHYLGILRNWIFTIPNFWLSDKLFACSQKAGRKFFGNTFLTKGSVIKNAIDINHFFYNEKRRVEIRKEFKITNKFVIGHVGNFTFPKNHFFILKVFSEVVKKEKNAILILVGDGERKNSLKEKAIQLGIEKSVVFLGIRDDVYNVMRSFDVFFFPSLYEGLGIALVEAQASGIPCVFSSVIPNEVNIVKENNRILSLKEKSEKWSDAILSLKDNKQSINTYKLIQESGFDINEESSKLIEEYEMVLRK